MTLRRARETVGKVHALFPGLVRPYGLLAAATALARPCRPLPRAERKVERIALALLGAATPLEGRLWPAVIGVGELPTKAPPGYRPMLPCPLWGDCWTREAVAAEVGDETRPRRATRRTCRTRASAGPSANATMAASAIRSS